MARGLVHVVQVGWDGSKLQVLKTQLLGGMSYQEDLYRMK